jgi:hypothetical protein
MQMAMSEFREFLEARDRDIQVSHFDVARMRTGAIVGRALSETREIQMDDNDLQKVISAVGIPLRLVEKVSQATLDQMVNDIIEREMQGGLTIMQKGQRIVSVGKPDMPYLPAARLFPTLLEHMPTSEWQIHDSHVGDYLAVDFQSPALTVEPLVGDVLNLGLHVEYSDLFFGTRQAVEGYSTRLICSNGAIRRQVVSGAQAKEVRIEATTPEVLQENMVARANTILKSLGPKLTEEVQTLAGHEVNGVAALTSVLHELGVPRNLHARIYRAFSEEQGNTMWHVHNAITRAARDAGVNYHVRTRLREYGGMVAEKSHSARCNSCNREM